MPADDRERHLAGVLVEASSDERSSASLTQAGVDGAFPLIEDTSNELLVSVVVAWEIAVKFGLGRLPLPEAPATYVPDVMRDLGATSVPVTQAHALGVATLPQIHRGPFDRLLVAQALELDATLVTGDALLASYPAKTLLV